MKAILQCGVRYTVHCCVNMTEALSFRLCVMQPAPYPSDDGRAALRQQWQHEDDMDAELIVNIGSSHA